MRLISEEIEQVEFLSEDVEGKKNYYIEGVFLQSEIENKNGRRFAASTFKFFQTTFKFFQNRTPRSGVNLQINSIFEKIEGDENAIMGLPIKQIKEYLNTLK